MSEATYISPAYSDSIANITGITFNAPAYSDIAIEISKPAKIPTQITLEIRQL